MAGFSIYFGSLRRVPSPEVVVMTYRGGSNAMDETS
jgi:hypothetical protein